VIGSLFAAFALLVANGFFVAVEFALVASRRTKIEPLADEGRMTAKAAMRSLAHLSRQLTACQVGITMASLALGAVAEPAFAALFEPVLTAVGAPEGLATAVGFGVALAVVVFLHLLLGEMVPKYGAIAMPERVLLALVVPFRAYATVFRPVIWLLDRLAAAGTRLVGVQLREGFASSATADELANMLAASREEGLIAETAHDLLSGALDFGERPASDVMVPIDDVIAVSLATTVAEAENVVIRTGHSRLPVRGARPDEIVGFVHVKDVLTVAPTARDRPIPLSRIRHMLKARATQPIDEVLVQMRREHIHLAVVVDDTGATLGIVSLEDVLEDLIGDITDESDAGLPPRVTPPRRRVGR
jgi:CBS domain containing-hemolysin-like protein